MNHLNQRIVTKQSGSSLILVLLIIAGIVTVIFGTQRLALVQFSQSTSEEDNLFAQKAAEAGVEDALRRERETIDLETPTGKVFRFDLTGGSYDVANLGLVAAGTDIRDSANFNPAHQYYDFSVDFRTDHVGDFINMSTSPDLARDDSLEISGFANTTNPDIYYLRYKFLFDGYNPADPNSCTVQLQQIRETGAGTVAYDQVTIHPETGGIYDSTNHGNLPIHTGASDLSNVVRLRVYGCNAKYAYQTVKGLNDSTPADVSVDSQTSTIIATGYAGGKAKRTLYAIFDRKKGRLINIYDFNVYSGQGSIQPRN